MTEALALLGLILAGCLIAAVVTTCYACAVVSGRCARHERRVGRGSRSSSRGR